jgi:hypothetical protein
MGFITKLFRNTDVKITFVPNNNLGKRLIKQHAHKQNKYEKNGIYQLTSPICNKKYIGQTGRPFLLRFREHFRDYKYANNKSKFAQHLLEEGHSFGPTDDKMDTINLANKCRMLDTIERFYIYRETQRDNQINVKLTVKSNAISEALVQNDPHRAHPNITILSHPHLSQSWQVVHTSTCKPGDCAVSLRK